MPQNGEQAGINPTHVSSFSWVRLFGSANHAPNTVFVNSGDCQITDPFGSLAVVQTITLERLLLGLMPDVRQRQVLAEKRRASFYEATCRSDGISSWSASENDGVSSGATELSSEVHIPG
jgi:hypothetical protein